MAQESQSRIMYRIFFAVCALLFRLIYGWYAGIDMFERGPLQTHFWVWTGIFCALIYMVLPMNSYERGS